MISESVGEAARAADLVIASEINREGKNGVELDFIENLILHSGCPILVLPHQGTAAPSFERIICGYDGSKEAGRAIREAVPLLLKANDVRDRLGRSAEAAGWRTLLRAPTWRRCSPVTGSR